MKTVFVVGAGPAGLFAAQKLALAGHQVVIFNRDIKPGGLAEYGIYPVKDKMKFGLRKQFAKVLSLPNVYYFGNLPVGREYALPVEALRGLNPAATIFSIGAQGTKKLGLPGENAKGVYSAKDFVYFYNQLPPFASMDFSTGRKVAIVGMGNVMVDIARWLLLDAPNRKTEEVTVVARRGPFEAKFDEKEFDHIETNFDRKDFAEELQRVKGRIKVEQDLGKLADANFPWIKDSKDPVAPVIRFRFLVSPSEIVPGPDGRIQKLRVVENDLVAKGEGTAAKATSNSYDLDVDTMIFAIGDSHDPKVGLPLGPEGYMTNPNAYPEDPKRNLFEVFDPQAGRVVPGEFVAGWARRASDGLVGIARHDGEVGAGYALQYLEGVQATQAATPQEIQAMLERKGIQVVSKPDLMLLGQAEEREAKARGLGYFKYSDNRAMLQAIERERVEKGEAVHAD